MSNTFTAQELADFYQKVADGGEIEHKYAWSDTFETESGSPDIESKRDQWRIKPTKKVIDLSVLIDSQIDCEFSDESEFLYMNTRITKLRVVDRGPSWYASNSPNQYLYCRPRMDHIHAWQGGECPLPEGFIVKVTFRNAKLAIGDEVASDKSYWSHIGSDLDIIAFEVLGLADGYVMPWEQDNG